MNKVMNVAGATVLLLALGAGPLAPSASAAPRLYNCSNVAENPVHYKYDGIYGSGTAYCNGGGAVQTLLQQYRGLGYWATKASSSATGTDVITATAVWICASGTGTQSYRTNAGGNSGAGATSATVRITCPG